MSDGTNRIFPVVLSGGSGSRLWPLSRESYPKQLLPLAGPHTLFQDTAARVSDADAFHPLVVVANTDHRFVIAEQLRQIGARSPRIMLEPSARNTAPAVTAAACLIAEDDPDAVMLVMPADHVIPDPDAFLAAVERAHPAARKGALALFGIEPTSANTGYGYIHQGPPDGPSVRRVSAFIEKPDPVRAEAFLRSGDYKWNSGIFLLPVRRVLEEMSQFEPALVRQVRQSIALGRRDLEFLRLDKDAFEACRAISFDEALMERTRSAVMAEGSFRWSDVGAWSSLWALAAGEASSNVELGDVVSQDVQGCYLRSEGPILATIGIRDLVVVATPDAVLVADRHADQDVKQLVQTLRERDHPAATQTRRVHRPWGWYETVGAGERFQVKRITVYPGHQLSLQKHFQRSEHWVVVGGTALVSVDGVESRLGVDQSTYIPLGAVHRLSNPGTIPLEVVEVQSGSYLGEDDIVRLDDDYARVEA